MALQWRLIYNREGRVFDLFAIPAAVAEGKLASRYLMATKTTPETLIVQRVCKKGILVGAEVQVDQEEVDKLKLDLAVQPKGGRGAPQPAETIRLEELMRRGKDKFEAEEANLEDPAALIYTSGTTGLPKGVIITHQNFLAECKITQERIKTTPEDRFASLVPFFHIYGLAVGLITALFRGCASVLVPQYTPRSFLQLMAKTGVKVLLAIPTQYLHLLLAARRWMPTPPPKLKYCISGAAPLPLKIIEAFKETFGVHITEGYGLTESTGAVSVNPPDRPKPGSIGLPCPGVTMKIMDEEGNELPVGKAGEIWIKSETVTKGYHHLPEETKKTLEKGWLKSGDIGYRDEAGYYFITDRKKDIILKGGFNISPRELEELLAQHPKVKEAAVIGLRKKENREAIKAFVVLVEGEKATPEEIIKYCREALATYKTPDEVEFIKVLPKSPTGKVLKKELREGYKDIRFIEKGEE